MSSGRSLALAGFIFFAGFPLLRADPPTDPQARKIYDHDKEWLSHFPAPFVATNIRGQGMEYAERRAAALDLVRRQRDFGVVSELMDALDKNSFLSGEICEILGEWKARRAIPLLKTVQSDDKRPKDVRDKAAKALAEIQGAKPDRPSNAYMEDGPASNK